MIFLTLVLPTLLDGLRSLLPYVLSLLGFLAGWLWLEELRRRHLTFCVAGRVVPCSYQGAR